MQCCEKVDQDQWMGGVCNRTQHKVCHDCLHQDGFGGWESNCPHACQGGLGEWESKREQDEVEKWENEREQGGMQSELGSAAIHHDVVDWNVLD